MGRKVPIKLGKASLGLVHRCKGFRVKSTLKTIFSNNRFGNSILRLAQQMYVGTSGESSSRLSLSFYLLEKVILQSCLEGQVWSRICKIG